LNEEYAPVFGKQFFENKPQLMQTLPIEKKIPINQEALPYERVSTIIENGQSFLAQECICKKEQGLLDNRCEKPLEVCLAIAPVPGVFHDYPLGHVITREEAYELLNKTEEAGLVHLTGNVQNVQFYICNCCGCCCGVLSGINKLGIPASNVVNSHYYAEIDPDKCTFCGICAEERCQVHAIEERDDFYEAIRDKCIGCGLCVGTCPEEAIQLVHKRSEEIVLPPLNEDEWFKERGHLRGVDFSVHQ
jgi:NAD-dependent dihydropyrimidine dehydrogenase PreA subunit